MTNKIIGVFFGSRSPEHDVSIITAQLIITELKKQGATVVPVYVGQDGQWYIGPELGQLKTFTTETFQHLAPKLKQYYLDLENSKGVLTFRQKGILKTNVVVEVAFPAFHGSFGEDGTAQGLFEMVGIPYVGCDVAASAIAMDKVLTKQLCVATGIPALPFVYGTKSEWEANRKPLLDAAKKELEWPMIVKPAHLGSSIGITKVKNAKELEEALEVGFHYDDKVMVEQCVEELGDMTCVLMGNDDPKPSLIQESVFDKDIFSYEDKYLNEGGAQLGNATKNLIIPANLDAKTTKAIQDAAIETFKAVGLSGISRVDFIYDKKKKKFYVSEINPLPGTLYHHLWKESGVEISEVVEKLVDLALEKAERKKSLTTGFKSDLLKYANSVKLSLKK